MECMVASRGLAIMPKAPMARTVRTSSLASMVVPFLKHFRVPMFWIVHPTELQVVNNLDRLSAIVSIPSRLLLLLSMAAALQGQTFKGVYYLYRATEKSKPKHMFGDLTISSAEKTISFVSYRKDHKQPVVEFGMKESAITGVVYERTSTPRYAAGLFIAWPLLFTKEKRHYLTFQYKVESGDGKYAIFHVDKGQHQEVIAATEAAIGKKVERSEEK
jgi:hypothetical protein